ncbi:MAG: hypothetical protein GY866_13960 [Proteobacteria bacterium]|nr:hypothetical protein [Pseudomonadota bacterium]
MKPNNDFLLRSIAENLATEIYPHLDSDYRKSTLMQIIQMLVGIAADYDQAGSRLIEENAQMRRIFSDALECVTDADLKERLAKATNGTETEYKVSDLDKAHQELGRLLIELHAHLETLEGDDARGVEESIWQELLMQSMRRIPVIMEVANAAELVEKA